MLSLCVGNVEDYYSPFAERLAPRAQLSWSLASRSLSPHALFWGGTKTVALADFKIDKDYAQWVKNQLGMESLAIAAPQALKAALGREREVSLRAWGTSSKVLRLAQKLKAGGFNVHPQLPSPNKAWTAWELDSKAGFREFAQKYGLPVPKGFVARNMSEAVGAALQLQSEFGGFALKAGRGTSGACQLLLAKAPRSRRAVIAQVLRAAKTIPELLGSPCVVEELIASSRTFSAQCAADGLGGGDVLFFARHNYKHGAHSVGAFMGPGAVEKKLERKLRAISAEAVSHTSRMGFAGVLGLDFIVEDDGEPLLLEMNARRTTLSFYGGICESLGRDDLSCLYGEIDLRAPWREVWAKLSGLWFHKDKRPEGVLMIPSGLEVDLWSGLISLSKSCCQCEWLMNEAKNALGVSTLT